jgi:hypothetical protein
MPPGGPHHRGPHAIAAIMAQPGDPRLANRCAAALRIDRRSVAARAPARAARPLDSLAPHPRHRPLADPPPARRLDMEAERERMMSTVANIRVLMAKIACLGADDEPQQPQQAQQQPQQQPAAACAGAAPAEQPATAVQLQLFYQQQVEREREARVRAAGRRCAGEAACAAIRRQVLAREQRAVQLEACVRRQEQALDASAAERGRLQDQVQRGRDAVQQLLGGIRSLQAQVAGGAGVIITAAAVPAAPGAAEHAAAVARTHGTPPPPAGGSSRQRSASPRLESSSADQQRPPSSCLSVRDLPTPQRIIMVDDDAVVQLLPAAAAAQQEPEPRDDAADDQSPPSSPAAASGRGKQQQRLLLRYQQAEAAASSPRN